MTRRYFPAALSVLASVLVLAACDGSSADPLPPSTAPPTMPAAAPPMTEADETVSATVTESTPPATSAAQVDPDEPIAASQLAVPPTGLGPMFTTSDAALPAQTTGALQDAGGQALPVDRTLDTFGIYGLPRPSGINSAVMELNINAARLGGTDGTSLSTEVLYMVASSSSIDDLLVDAARTFDVKPAPTPVTVPDYDGTTGDPRCARLQLDPGTPTALSVEGCQYRADPLTEVRSIGFRRLNMLVAGPPVLPAVFDGVPDELLAAGELAGYSATFGRPTGPSGSTVQLRAEVHLVAPLTGLGEDWQADGPGRWWSDTATVTVDAGTATWQSSTRAAQ